MLRQVIVDTGVLIALIDRRDYHHAWAAQQFTDIDPLEFTCKADLSAIR